jgi:hypothetical protein
MTIRPFGEADWDAVRAVVEEVAAHMGPNRPARGAHSASTSCTCLYRLTR